MNKTYDPSIRRIRPHTSVFRMGLAERVLSRHSGFLSRQTTRYRSIGLSISRWLRTMEIGTQEMPYVGGAPGRSNGFAVSQASGQPALTPIRTAEMPAATERPSERAGGFLARTEEKEDVDRHPLTHDALGLSETLQEAPEIKASLSQTLASKYRPDRMIRTRSMTVAPDRLSGPARQIQTNHHSASAAPVSVESRSNAEASGQVSLEMVHPTSAIRTESGSGSRPFGDVSETRFAIGKGGVQSSEMSAQKSVDKSKPSESSRSQKRVAETASSSIHSPARSVDSSPAAMILREAASPESTSRSAVVSMWRTTSTVGPENRSGGQQSTLR